MSGLNFCMVTTFYPPYNFGGDGIGVQRLSRALVQRGHSVTVIHDVDAYNALHNGPEPALHAEPPGLDVVRIRSGLGILSPLLTQQTGRPVANGKKIREILGDGNFDVIMFHNVSLIGGPGVLSVGHSLKLYEAHEHWLVCPTHVLWRHNREVCTGRQCLRCVVRHHRPPQLWRYTGYLERQLRHIDMFIAKSKFSRDTHYQFGFPRSMDVVPYFLPDDGILGQTEASPPPHQRPYFLFVGRLERIKGLDDVIPLFREYGDADLLIAGEGTYAPALRQLAQGIGNVRFLGSVAPNALRQYYRHAIAVIVPSVCFETFGIVLIEAFRQGTPVIARRIGPFPEIVERCSGGELFADREELAVAMRRLQGDGSLRRRLEQSARKGFEQYWSENAVLPQYLDVCRRAAERRNMPHVAEALRASNVPAS